MKTMYALKPLSHEGIGGALAKAEHYRHLNEPAEAESICRDILEIEPENQRAVVCLILSLSDQLAEDRGAFSNASKLLQRLANAYDRTYYAGILWERRSKARYHEGGHDVHHTVHEWMQKALSLFEEAERMRPAGNDDALLRWNTCVRFLQRHPDIAPRPAEEPAAILSE